MKIRIDIECDTIHEFSQHLKKIQEDIKKEVQLSGKNPTEDWFEDGKAWSDDNCYGSHNVQVLPF